MTAAPTVRPTMHDACAARSARSPLLGAALAAIAYLR